MLATILELPFNFEQKLIVKKNYFSYMTDCQIKNIHCNIRARKTKLPLQLRFKWANKSQPSSLRIPSPLRKDLDERTSKLYCLWSWMGEWIGATLRLGHRSVFLHQFLVLFSFLLPPTKMKQAWIHSAQGEKPFGQEEEKKGASLDI